MKKELFHIGTSGWHYKGWVGNLYPEKMKPENMLEFYAKKFNSVELNTSFYGMPSKASIEKWYDLTPNNFIFSCKASRYLTHIKRLKNYENGLQFLLERLALFGSKLGPILFQLPPTFAMDYERLERFLMDLAPEFHYTFEFRNTSWLCQEIYDLLAKYKIALCFYDFKGIQAPEIVLSDFVYLRMHGPRLDPYVGHYEETVLKNYAEKFLNWQRQGKKIYCYFDNDQKACAPMDAALLNHLLQ